MISRDMTKDESVLIQFPPLRDEQQRSDDEAVQAGSSTRNTSNNLCASRKKTQEGKEPRQAEKTTRAESDSERDEWHPL